MKKIIIITIGLFSFFSSNAQTDTLGYDLIFKKNANILIDTTVYLGVGGSIQAFLWDDQYTVPNNSVAKINLAKWYDEYISGQGCIDHYVSIIINGVFFDKNYSSGGTIDWGDFKGVWLDSGETIAVQVYQRTNNGNGNNCHYTYNCIVSITEYLKIPITSD